MAKAIDPKFVVNITGKDFVLYQGLLGYAHEECGLVSLECDIVQFPTEENNMSCICKATAIFNEVSEENVPFIKTFTDIGDASPDNCESYVAKGFIRMASTRAKGRVLRDGTGIGTTMYEELDSASSDGSESSQLASKTKETKKEKPTMGELLQEARDQVKKKFKMGPEEMKDVGTFVKSLDEGNLDLFVKALKKRKIVDKKEFDKIKEKFE